jgi:hypothetical protein
VTISASLPCTWRDLHGRRFAGGGDNDAWERVHGSLTLATAFATKGLMTPRLAAAAAEAATSSLSHAEPRVREQAGITLGAIAASAGGEADVWASHCGRVIIDGIRTSLERDEVCGTEHCVP